MHKPKELVIDCDKWCRGGKGGSYSALLNPQGYMCCLGFYAKACGLTDNQIRYIVDPGALYVGSQFRLPDMLNDTAVNENTAALICANDDGHMTPDSERRKNITKLFKNIDVDVTFINIKPDEEINVDNNSAKGI